MIQKLGKSDLERYSRQIILKDVSFEGQRKIYNSKVLIVGMGGLGCPVADSLSRCGIGTLGIVDHDKINLSNLHRQTLYDFNDIGKFKVDVASKKISKINKKIKIFKFKTKIDKSNITKIIKKFDIIIDGSDNFSTKFLLNKYSIKFKKILIVGAISKFDGHLFTFDFKKKNKPCLKCFYQINPSDDILNCESEGILGPIGVIIGNLQSNEALKKILKFKNTLEGNILIINLKDLNFRIAKFTKKNRCIC